MAQEHSPKVQRAALAVGDRVYRVARVPFAVTLQWSEGADERTAIEIRHSAVPPGVRAALIRMLDRGAAQ